MSIAARCRDTSSPSFGATSGCALAVAGSVTLLLRRRDCAVLSVFLWRVKILFRRGLSVTSTFKLDPEADIDLRCSLALSCALRFSSCSLRSCTRAIRAASSLEGGTRASKYSFLDRFEAARSRPLWSCMLTEGFASVSSPFDFVCASEEGDCGGVGRA